MPIRRKDRIPDLLDLSVTNDHRQAAKQRLPRSLEHRQSPGPGELQLRVREDRERQVQALYQLLLIGGVLRREPEDLGAGRAYLGVVVSKRTRLRGATSCPRGSGPSLRRAGLPPADRSAGRRRPPRGPNSPWPEKPCGRRLQGAGRRGLGSSADGRRRRHRQAWEGQPAASSGRRASQACIQYPAVRFGLAELLVVADL